MSALLNTILGESDVVTIRPKQWCFDNYVGLYMERGTLIIQGNVNDKLAHGMKGGKIVLRGDANEDYGNHMNGGELIIEGKVNRGGLHFMKNGRCLIKGINNNGSFSFGSFGLKGIGSEQEGGTIEFACDIPYSIEEIGYKQKGGELRVAGNVYCNINTLQVNGSTCIERNVISGEGGLVVGREKKGGTTVIDGNCMGEGNSQTARVSIGVSQEGGLIHVKGDVYGDIAIDGYPTAEIIIDKNVHGNVGNMDCAGTTITIKGSVKGHVGCPVRDFMCTIYGDVRGNEGVPLLVEK